MRPNSVLKVVRYDESVSSLICQNLFLASKTEKTLALLSLGVATSSIVGSG